MAGQVNFAEQADHIGTPSAGNGYLWCKDDTPSALYFTDDAGTDHRLAAGVMAAANLDAVVSTPAASDAITATQYLNVLGNATLADAGLTHSQWTVDDTNKRFTYTGDDTRDFWVHVSFSMTSTKNSEDCRFRLAKNGTVDADTEIIRMIGTGTDVGAASVQGTFSLATNDYIELWATLDTSSSNTITIEKANIAILPVESGTTNDQKSITLYVEDYSTALSTGDGKNYFRVPEELDGMNLVTAEAQLGAAQSTSGAVTVDLARLRFSTPGGARTAVDMLSTNITIDVSTWDSKDSAAPRVIDSANDDVAEGDLIRVDIDAVGNGSQGLFVSLGFV